jgi:hypothetical protein
MFSNNIKLIYSKSLNIKQFAKYLLVLFFFLLFLSFILLGKESINKLMFSWSIIILMMYLLFKTKDNIMLFTVYSIIAYCNYSIVVTNYLNPLTSSYFISFSEDYISYLGLIILFVFTLLLVLTIPIKIIPTYLNEPNFIKKNDRNTFFITSIIVIILIYILIFQFNRPDVAGLRGSPAPLYEYSTIFFIVGFHFAGKNQKAKLILTLLLFTFALQNFIFGGRIIGVQLLFIYFIMFYSHKVRIIKLIPFIIIGFIMMSLIGMDRASLLLSAQAIKDVLKNIENRMFALDTSYSAYFTSLTFLKVREILSISDRLDLFMKFMLSIIFGGRIENSSLPLYTRSIYLHYNGGIFPYYFYFYLGWFGVIISTFLIRIYTHFITNKEMRVNGFKNCISVYFVATTFRWYLYTPLIILRGVMLFIIVYFGFQLIYRLK